MWVVLDSIDSLFLQIQLPASPFPRTPLIQEKAQQVQLCSTPRFAADGDAHLDDCAAGVQELCGVLRFLHNSAQLFSRILVMK